MTAVTHTCAIRNIASHGEIRNVPRRLSNPVTSRPANSVRARTRAATIAFAVVVFLASSLPACTGICCITPQATAASLMAAMPCCANMPSMQSDAKSPRQDATLVAGSSLNPPSATINLALPISHTAAPLAASAVERGHSDSAPATSVFLRNEQFRI